MSDTFIGVIGLFVLIILALGGLELGFAMIVTGFLGFAYLRSTHAAINLLSKEFFDAFASYTFTVIPLFVLMGQVAFNAGIANELYKSARKFLGHIPGGVGHGHCGGRDAIQGNLWIHSSHVRNLCKRRNP
jgi:TRAP-type mannitol/chloroaromatic compound transport system permease large subunit